MIDTAFRFCQVIFSWIAQNAKDTPIPSRTGGFEGSLTGVCVVIILKVKRPCTTEQFKDNKHPDEDVAK